MAGPEPMVEMAIAHLSQEQLNYSGIFKKKPPALSN